MSPAEQPLRDSAARCFATTRMSRLCRLGCASASSSSRCDADTDAFLAAAARGRHSWLRTRLHRVLRFFVSDFDANGLLDMYPLHRGQPRAVARAARRATRERLLDVGAGYGQRHAHAAAASPSKSSRPSCPRRWRARCAAWASSAIASTSPSKTCPERRSICELPQRARSHRASAPHAASLGRAARARRSAARRARPALPSVLLRRRETRRSRSSAWRVSRRPGRRASTSSSSASLSPSGSTLLKLARVPYLSFGDTARDLYELDDAIVSPAKAVTGLPSAATETLALPGIFRAFACSERLSALVECRSGRVPLTLRSNVSKTVLLACEKPFSAAARDEVVAIIKQAGYTANVLEIVQGQGPAARRDRQRGRGHRAQRRDRRRGARSRQAARSSSCAPAPATTRSTPPRPRRKGIAVMNTPGQNANAVAELVFGMLVYTARDKFNGKVGSELKGKTLGLHAFGAVGRAVADHRQGLRHDGVRVRPVRDAPSKSRRAAPSPPPRSRICTRRASTSRCTSRPRPRPRARSARSCSRSCRRAARSSTPRARRSSTRPSCSRCSRARKDFRYVSDIAPSDATVARLKEKFDARASDQRREVRRPDRRSQRQRRPRRRPPNRRFLRARREELHRQ